MCDPITIGALALTATAGGMQAYGQYKEGSATNKYYKSVANTQQQQGDIDYVRGEKQSDLIQDSAKFEGVKQKGQAAQVASSQRAAMAANGIDLSSVTAGDLASETMSKARLDELAIRYNADVGTWNTMEDAKYKKWSAYTQANQSRAMGKNALAKGKNDAGLTLLSTAASMAMMGAGAVGNSSSTQGASGWLKGYKNAPAGSKDMGTFTLLR
jgi:hypothetical protein